MNATTAGRAWRRDVVIAAALGVVAYVVGMNYLRTATAAGLVPEFKQYEFGPGVMLACGRGFVNPAAGESAVLDRFLRLEIDSMQCSDVDDGVRVVPVDRVQGVSKALIGTAAMLWAASSISWSRLLVLSAMLFAATVATTYLLARVVAGAFLAALVAVAVILSPLHWSQIPHIRDYSKAPFLLALIWIIALIVRGPFGIRRLLALSAAFGLIMGLGFGFRSDVVIVAPMFLVAVWGFIEGGVFRSLGKKFAALATAALTFVAAGWPVFGTYGEGGGMQVVALLGYVTPFDAPLGVERGPYEFGTLYSDWYMGALIRDVGRRELRVQHRIPVYRAEYNAAANLIIRELMTTMPADIIVRAYASILDIVRLPASSWTDSHWPGHLPEGGFWRRVFDTRGNVVQRLAWLWPLAVAAALLVGSALDLRLTVFATLMLFYFAAYPAIQFHERHMFHLDIVPPLALAFLGAQAARAVRNRPAVARQPLVRAGAFALGVAALAIVPVETLRAYQAPRVRAALADRLAAPQEAVQLTPRTLDGGRVVFETPTMPAQTAAEASPGVVTSEYFVARVGGAECDALRVPLTLRYRSPYIRGNLSTTTVVQMPRGRSETVALLTPGFYRYRPGPDAADLTDRWSDYQFSGFEVDQRDARCLAGASRILDTTPFTLLLTARLPPAWRELTPYQTIALVEPRRDANQLTTTTAPEGAPVSRKVLSAPLEPLDVEVRAGALRDAGGGWTIDGVGGIGGSRGSFAYLLAGRPRETRSGDQLIVQGTLHSGGLTIGLLRDDRWLLQTAVTTPGPFLSVVQVPSDGMSTVVIANNIPNGGLANHFDIARAGWYPAVPAK